MELYTTDNLHCLKQINCAQINILHIKPVLLKPSLPKKVWSVNIMVALMVYISILSTFASYGSVKQHHFAPQQFNAKITWYTYKLLNNSHACNGMTLPPSPAAIMSQYTNAGITNHHPRISGSYNHPTRIHVYAFSALLIMTCA